MLAPLLSCLTLLIVAAPPSTPLRPPLREERLAIQGLQRPVRIVTDRNGIPHLRAASIPDLYLAWGYVTARDRLWQMAHARQAGRGELWRWFGNRSLRTDGGAQLFELTTHARRSWDRDRRDPATRIALERFSQGVNAYLAACRSGARPWPRELASLGVRLEDWTPADCALVLLGMGVLLDLALPELAEAETLRVRGPGWFEQRRRFETDWTYATIPDSVARRRYGRAPRPRLPGSPFPAGSGVGWRAPGVPGARDPEQGASNVFAVGPRHSASGAPLLANDLHLSLTAPGPVYALHVSVPDTVEAAGVAVPGLPILVSGRNRRAAWGISSLAADVIDLYADTLSRDGRSVRSRGRWVRMREEPYAMRFRALGLRLPTFGQSRRYTPHGPVVALDRKRRLAFSARWAGLEGPLSLRGVIGLERSSSAAEVALRCRTLILPTLNVVAADVEGRVLYQTVGAVPRRGFAHVAGALPSDGRHEWLGRIPADEMPAWDVPRDGFVVNGNNLPIDAPYPYALPRFDWIHDRAARMAQRLAGDASLTLADVRSVQNDLYSRAAERLVPRLLRCADSLAGGLAPGARAALDTLRGWNYVCRRDERGPTLFRAWLGAFLERSNLGDAPALAVAALDGRAPEALRDPATGRTERAAVAAVRSLEIALEELARRLGPDPAAWTWGRAHRAHFRHALGWRDPSLHPPVVPMDGDNSTPSVGPSRLPKDLHVVFGPVWRHLVDLAADSSLAALPPGNTGMPGHDRDQLQRWASHRYVPLHLDWSRVEALRESELLLDPAAARR